MKPIDSPISRRRRELDRRREQRTVEPSAMVFCQHPKSWLTCGEDNHNYHSRIATWRARLRYIQWFILYPVVTSGGEDVQPCGMPANIINEIRVFSPLQDNVAILVPYGHCTVFKSGR